MRTIHRDIASALIFSKDGKLLQGLRDPKKGGVYIDCWQIPGGGIEEGEDKVEALKREVLEEVGLDISPYAIELVDDKGTGEAEKTLKDGERVLAKMKFNTYKVVLHDKNAAEIPVVLDGEFIEYKWSDMSQLRSLQLAKPTLELFTRLGYRL